MLSELLTPDPLDLRNLLASGAGSGFFFKKDLADTPSSPASPSLSEDEPDNNKIRLNFRNYAFTTLKYHCVQYSNHDRVK